MTYSISREELLTITNQAARETVALSVRGRLEKAMKTTSAVAVGWFHCDGADCPMRQIRYTNQRFQNRFDQVMQERLGITGVKSAYAVRVEVTDLWRCPKPKRNATSGTAMTASTRCDWWFCF